MTAPMTPQDRLAPEMRAVLDRLLAEDGPVPDTTLLPPDEGRALSEAANRRWNMGEPTMAQVFRRDTPLGNMANVYLPDSDQGDPVCPWRWLGLLFGRDP